MSQNTLAPQNSTSLTSSEQDTVASGLNLRDYLTVLRRRRAIFLQTFFLILAAGIIITFTTKPTYHASAKLLVEGPAYNLNTVDTSNPLSELVALGQQQTVETQVEVLQAQPLLDQVAKQAGAATLSVAAIKNTNVITVGADAFNPKIAAAAPNTLLDLYVKEDADQNLTEIKSAREFVVKQGRVAHRKLQDSESALQTFKERNHVGDLSKNRDDKMARVADLESVVQKSNADLQTLRAQTAQVQQQMAGEPAILSYHLPATNPSVALLKEEIAKDEVQRVGLLQPGGYTPRAPPVRALDAQIAALRVRAAGTPPLDAPQSSSLNTLHESLHARLIELQTLAVSAQMQSGQATTALAVARSQMGHFAGWEIALARLTRARDQAETADRMFTDKDAELSLREKARHATARIIERADVPRSPVRPDKFKNLISALMLGLFAGLCLALLQEFMDDRIMTPADGERLLELPTLGCIPALATNSSALLIEMPGWNPVAESYRILRTGIQFAGVDKPPRTLLITSAVPGEGKTTTSINLAFAMGLDGKRVILADTDLRRPSLHRLLHLPDGPGLTETLLGEANLRDALMRHRRFPNVLALTSGEKPPNPSELLGSQAFRSLTEHLCHHADIVILDSPPLMAAADAQVLASQVDGVVLVVECGKTKKAAVRQAVALLRQTRAPLLGIVYNKTSGMDAGGYYDRSAYAYTETETPSLLNGNRNGHSQKTPTEALP